MQYKHWSNQINIKLLEDKIQLYNITLCLPVSSADNLCKQFGPRSGPTLGPKVIKRFPCSTQLSTKFILLINVKMPTIVGILTFISMINTSKRLKARNFFICCYFTFNEQLKFHAQLS